jgi:hypothetical protein
MSLQKINKKTFKSPFNNPLKHSTTDTERNISFREHDARTQCQVMVRPFYTFLLILPVGLQLETT